MRGPFFFALALFACDDHKFSGGTHGGGGVEVTGEGYEATVEILANQCSGCHGSNAAAPDVTGDLCETLVGVSSAQLSTMNYITANDVDNSYLIHKVKGTHLDVGGGGQAMPMGTPMSESDIAILETWVSTGASCEISADEPSSEDTGIEDTGDDDTGVEDTGPTDEEAAIARGDQIYTNRCASCHGTQGSNGFAPNLAQLVPMMSDLALTNIMVDAPGSMTDNLVTDEAEQQDLLAFMRDKWN